MNHVSLQALTTWGTVTAAVVSAALLTATGDESLDLHNDGLSAFTQGALLSAPPSSTRRVNREITPTRPTHGTSRPPSRGSEQPHR